MEVSIFWVIVGVCVWPELLLCVILWKLGHPYLGLFALICASTTSVKTVVKDRIVYRDIAQRNVVNRDIPEWP